MRPTPTMHQIWIGGAGTVLGAFLLWLFTNVWSTIWEWLKAGADETYFLLTYRVTLHAWAVALGVSALSYCSWRLAKLIWPDKPSQTATWRDYRVDNFFSVHWSWDYSATGDIVHLTPFCISDMTELKPVGVIYGPTRLECETCHTFVDFKEGPQGVENKIKRQIGRKINTGKWHDLVKVAADLPPAS